MIELLSIGIILFTIEIAYIQLANRLGIVDKPHLQSSHSGVIVRGGGVVFYATYFIWTITHDFSGYGGLIGLSFLALVSFWDDIYGVSPKIRLACQFVAILMMFYHSGLIHKPAHVIMILSVICVGALNIYNFMDGINGMTGGYSLVVSLALLYVDICHVHFINPLFIIYVIIAILVFIFFNFRIHAICFAGDVGSLSIGFILVYFVLRLALQGHSMSWVAMFSVYIVDGVLTILHRILLKENLMKPHKKHVYQIMANELELPHLLVSGIYMGLQAVCCIWYIVVPGYLTFSLQIGLLSFAYVYVKKKALRFSC